MSYHFNPNWGIDPWARETSFGGVEILSFEHDNGYVGVVNMTLTPKDIDEARLNCRHDKVNEFLLDLYNEYPSEWFDENTPEYRSFEEDIDNGDWIQLDIWMEQNLF